jgi:hypothetical protein
VLLSCWLTSCGGDTGTGEDASIDLDSLPTLQLIEEQRLGSVSDLGIGFTSVSTLQLDSDHNLYVYEGSEKSIRVYSPGGQLLRRIGRAGDGPGEFRGSNLRFGLRADTVWAVSDLLGEAKLTLFRTTGELLSVARIDAISIRGHSPNSSIVIAPVEMDDDGLFVGDRSGTRGRGEPPPPRDSLLDTIWVPRVRFNALGKIVDTAGTYPYPRYDQGTVYVSAGSGRYAVPDPPFAGPITVPYSNGFLRVYRYPADAAGRHNFRIVRLGRAGDTLFTRTVRYTPVAIPESELDSVARDEARSSGRMLIMTHAGSVTLDRNAADSLVAYNVIRAAMKWPRFRVPVDDYRKGRDGSLWLSHPGTAPHDTRWFLLGADGAPLGTLTFPPETFARWSSADTVWAVQYDSLDVPFVVRFSLKRN